MTETMADSIPSPRLKRFARLIVWFVAGGIIGLVAMAIVVRVSSRESGTPALAKSDWELARKRWNAGPVENYDIEVVVTGRQAANYSVQVRDGKVVNATRNGNVLPQQRTWTTWTVEGMFETIARDLDSVQRHETGRAEPTTPRLQLRAAFDPQLGYPQRYLRTEMVRLGANPEVSWNVVRFEWY
jgi:hypothetical protein